MLKYGRQRQRSTSTNLPNIRMEIPKLDMSNAGLKLWNRDRILMNQKRDFRSIQQHWQQFVRKY